jgi:hypothetical protein
MFNPPPAGCVFITIAIFTISAPAADEPAKGRPTTLNDLSMEVAALQALHQFQFTPAQREKLRRLAAETVQETGARHVPQASEAYRAALLELRTALAKDSPAEQIDKLQEKLDKLREKESPDLDDGIDVTDAARKQAPEILRQLSARQLVGFLGLYGDSFPDPFERITEALNKVRAMDAATWKKTREDLSEEVGRLVAGLDADKATEVGDQVVQLLIRARALKEEEFRKQRPELEKEARQLLGELGPFDVMRNVMEVALAELLSNPRLPAALAARAAK